MGTLNGEKAKSIQILFTADIYRIIRLVAVEQGSSAAAVVRDLTTKHVVDEAERYGIPTTKGEAQ